MRVAVAIIITLAIYAIIFFLGLICDRYLGRPWDAWRVKVHKRRLENRLNAGHDRFFEELRSLEAYDPSRTLPESNNRYTKYLAHLVLLALIAFKAYRFIPENM